MGRERKEGENLNMRMNLPWLMSMGATPEGDLG
jgi:hypothetical protein